MSYYVILLFIVCVFFENLFGPENKLDDSI